MGSISLQGSVRLLRNSGEIDERFLPACQSPSQADAKSMILSFPRICLGCQTRAQPETWPNEFCQACDALIESAIDDELATFEFAKADSAE